MLKDLLIIREILQRNKTRFRMTLLGRQGENGSEVGNPPLIFLVNYAEVYLKWHVSPLKIAWKM